MVYRPPVDVTLGHRKEDPRSQKDNAFFRQMLRDFRPPACCQEVIVVAAAI